MASDFQPLDYAPGPVAEWHAYGGAPGGGHYSAASQITRDNVHALQQAWVYRTGDKREAGKGMLDGVAVDNVPGSSWQLTPLVIGDTLYGCSALNRMFALDAATGVEKWSYDPGVDTSQDMLVNCRNRQVKLASDLSRQSLHFPIRFEFLTDGSIPVTDIVQGIPLLLHPDQK